jgi:hypothetical protein
VDDAGLGEAVRLQRRGVRRRSRTADRDHGAPLPARAGLSTRRLRRFPALSLGTFNRLHLGRLVFGAEAVQESLSQAGTILDQWGYRSVCSGKHRLRGVFSQALLIDRSPRLQDLDTAAFDRLHAHPATNDHHGEMLYALQRAVAALGHCDPPVRTGHNHAPGIGSKQEKLDLLVMIGSSVPTATGSWSRSHEQVIAAGAAWFDLASIPPVIQALEQPARSSNTLACV